MAINDLARDIDDISSSYFVRLGRRLLIHPVNCLAPPAVAIIYNNSLGDISALTHDGGGCQYCRDIRTQHLYHRRMNSDNLGSNELISQTNSLSLQHRRMPMATSPNPSHLNKGSSDNKRQSLNRKMLIIKILYYCAFSAIVVMFYQGYTLMRQPRGTKRRTTVRMVATFPATCEDNRGFGTHWYE